MSSEDEHRLGLFKDLFSEAILSWAKLELRLLPECGDGDDEGVQR
jgi:hypothetical protein